MKSFNVEDKSKTEAALLAANGKATSHTFTTVGQILEVCGEAEVQLHSFGLSKAERVGARVVAVSGGAVPNAYKYQRIVTRVTLLRKSSGWHLEECVSFSVYPSDKCGMKCALTTTQRDIAVAKFQKRFSIQQPITQE